MEMISKAIVGGELEALKKMQEAPEQKAKPKMVYRMNRHQRRGLEKLKRKEANLRKRLAVLDDKLR